MARRDLDEWFWQVGAELQRLSDEMFRSGPTLPSRRFWEPKIDLIEDENCFIIKAEIAGVKGDDIQLLYVAERHAILLKGDRREEDFQAASRTGIYQLEIYYGEFEREVKLPEIPIEPGKIKAQYRNGILLVQVPKAAAVRKPTNVKKI